MQTPEQTSHDLRLGWRWPRAVLLLLVVLAGLAALGVLSRYSYVLFHTLAELLSVAIAWVLFIVVWNARRWTQDDFLSLLGVAWAAAGVVDLVHTLSFPGISAFPGHGSNLTVQLWIAARYLQSISLLAGVLLLGKRARLPAGGTLAGYVAIVALLLLLIFAGWFPVCYVEGVGLTPFKRGSESIIVLILGTSLALIWSRRHHLGRGLFPLIVAAISATILSEVAFTFYGDVYDVLSMLGHLAKIVAFGLLYVAIVRAFLQQPYDTLFEDLQTANIAARQTVEAALRSNRERLRLTLEAARAGTWEWDLRTDRNFWSEELWPLYGLAPHSCEPSYEAWRASIHPADRTRAEQAMQSAARDGTELNAEWRVCHPDGSERWVMSRGRPVWDAGGNVVRFIGIVLDITELKQVEGALRASEERYRLIAENTADVVWLMDPVAGNFTYVSPSVQRLRGYSPEEVMAQPANEALTPESRELVSRTLAANLPAFTAQGRGRLSFTTEVDQPCRDGSIVNTEVTTTYTFNAGGQVQIVGVTRDITARKAAEAQLLRTLEALRRSNAELEQFAYVASHDLQEPLRTLTGVAELLQRRYRGQLDARADEYIGYIVDAAGRMHTLINDLLALSRVGTRGLPSQPTSADAALDLALANLAQAIHDKGALIRRGPLPAVRADRTQLALLLQNLISNAIKFNQSQPLEVQVSAERLPEGWRFAVSDNGIGIDPQHFERIFVIFQRLHTTREYPGTGMGLALCRKIVDRHGGRLWVESQPGRGSTFYFTLPDQETNSYGT
jgi:PAS domain S-box-containing protein